MRKKIAILTILIFIISIMAPLSALASNGLGLHLDVKKALSLRGGSIEGSSGIRTESIHPEHEFTRNLDVMIAKRGKVQDYNVDGSLAYYGQLYDGHYEGGYEYQAPKMVDGVTQLECTEKSTYSEPTSSKVYKTVSYTYIMEKQNLIC